MTERGRGTQLTGLVSFALLLPAGLFSLLEPAAAPRLWGAAVALALGLHGAQLLLDRWGYGKEPFLFPLAAMLSVVGLALIYRLDPRLAARQYLWLWLGLAVFLLTVRLFGDYGRLERYRYAYMALGILFLAATAVVGTEVGGARSWLSLGSFRFQPAEGVKVLLVLFLASYLQEKRELLSGPPGQKWSWPPARALGPLVMLAALSLVLLALQKDLGTALIFFLTFLLLLFVATGRAAYLALGVAFFALGAGTSYLLFPHIRVRVAVWLDPWSRMDGAGYQLTQALFALGSGGLVGSGLGGGRPDLIPAASTDFIFAVLGEELGLAGSLAVLMCYMLLIYRGLRAGWRAPDDFGLLLAAGTAVVFALQALVIVGGVTRLLPLTGITLPFMSYGGSSLLVNYALLGFLLAVSRGGRAQGAAA